MSRPRYRWWGFVRKMIRDFPMLEKSLEDLHQQNVTADHSGMPKGGGDGRGLESVAMRKLERDDQQCYDAVADATELTKLRPDGQERMKLIHLMYWAKKPMTARSAAAHLHIADITAVRWHGDFVRLVAERYGFTVR
ncbi:MAG: hypothetical protein J6V34_02470 [Oscillospiraceae bacterium]|nr:hypothetical protein [Oscillospiraceae bacterium]